MPRLDINAESMQIKIGKNMRRKDALTRVTKSVSETRLNPRQEELIYWLASTAETEVALIRSVKSIWVRSDDLR